MTKYREIILACRTKSQPDQHRTQCWCIQDYGQQGFESCQRAEPRMAIGAKIH